MIRRFLTSVMLGAGLWLCWASPGLAAGANEEGIAAPVR